MSLSVAFVTPRFGPDIYGGAEIAARTILEAVPEFQATAYSTTLRGFGPAAARYPEGEESLGDIRVHRFDPDPIDFGRLSELTQRMQHEELSRAEEEEWIGNCYNSSRLLSALSDSKHDIYAFTPYLSATTYFGATLKPSRSVVFPALHDEAVARMKIYREWFSGLRAVGYYSQPERALANHLYRLDAAQRVLGLPIGHRPTSNGGLQKLPGRPYLLYVGRLSPEKGVVTLLEWMERVPEVDLVVVGEGNVSLPRRVVHFSGLDPTELSDCYARALATVQLSTMESFSLVLFESWQHATPVITSALASVPRHFCLRSNGGLPVSTGGQFRKAVRFLVDNPTSRDVLGEQGREFTRRRYAPGRIGSRYRAFFHFLVDRERRGALPIRLYCPNLLRHDAVANYVRQIARMLEDARLDYSIWVESRDGLWPGPIPAQRLADRPPSPRESGLHWFQYPGYYPAISRIERCEGPTVFDFHGVTPRQLWPNRDLEESHRRIALAGCADRVLVHSRFLAQQLTGLHNIPSDKVETIPFGVDLDRFRPGPRDGHFLQTFGLEGKRILLYVGRLAPNKRLDVVASALSKLPDEWVLVAVGDTERPEYAEVMEDCQQVCRRANSSRRMVFTGKLPDAQLGAAYRSADLFVSASLHEGFGIPFLEAMASGVPCVGSDAAAIPELIGRAGLLFRAGDVQDLVEKIQSLSGDPELYRRCLTRGLDRAHDWSLQSFQDRLLPVIQSLAGASP